MRLREKISETQIIFTLCLYLRKVIHRPGQSFKNSHGGLEKDTLPIQMCFVCRYLFNAKKNQSDLIGQPLFNGKVREKNIFVVLTKSNHSCLNRPRASTVQKIVLGKFEYLVARNV